MNNALHSPPHTGASRPSHVAVSRDVHSRLSPSPHETVEGSLPAGGGGQEHQEGGSGRRKYPQPGSVIFFVFRVYKEVNVIVNKDFPVSYFCKAVENPTGWRTGFRGGFHGSSTKGTGNSSNEMYPNLSVWPMMQPGMMMESYLCNER